MLKTPSQSAAPVGNSLLEILKSLHRVKLGGNSNGSGELKVKRRDLIFILGNLTTLLANGVSLKKSLETLSREHSLKKYFVMLDGIRLRIESGESFSSALAAFPDTFSELVINQIRVGEQSGAVAETLSRIVGQLEKGNRLRTKILKQLSYPIIVSVAGVGVVAFMLGYIVPVFEETYQKARIPLPFATRMLIMAGDVTATYGWILLLAIIAGIFGYKQLRANPQTALTIDRAVLRIPLVGSWLRDIAVFQFMDSLGTMMESGFKLVDALAVSGGSVGNRAVRKSVEDLRSAVIRGERLSHEIEKHHQLFPPVVSQLVIVGEQTGNLSKSSLHVREYLRREIERKAGIFVGAIEPILTITLAATIGGILLAIYMPMFSMLDVVQSNNLTP